MAGTGAEEPRVDDVAWNILREQLLAQAYLFEDATAYEAGVRDALAAVRLMLGNGVIAPTALTLPELDPA